MALKIVIDSFVVEDAKEWGEREEKKMRTRNNNIRHTTSAHGKHVNFMKKRRKKNTEVKRLGSSGEKSTDIDSIHTDREN